MTSTPTLLAEIGERIAAVSPQWAAVVTATECAPRTEGYDLRSGLASGVETIYEGFLFHYGTPRTCSSGCGMSLRLLIGDYCYAEGLRDVSATGDVEAVSTLAALIGDIATLATEHADDATIEARWELALTALSE
jgi:hypothetical protein